MTGDAGRRTGPGGGTRPEPEGAPLILILLAEASVILFGGPVVGVVTKTPGFGA